MEEFVSVPAIIIVCYLIGEAIKLIGDKANKFIPCACGFFGGVLGLVVFYTIPDFIGANNWINALGIGIVSGFAATGVNQVYKQAKK